MKLIHVRDLPQQLSRVIEDAQNGETTQLISDGDIVAQIVPPPAKPTQAEIDANLRSLADLRAEAAKYVTEPTDAAALISEMRDRPFYAPRKDGGMINEDDGD